jgi:hypothetical protein
MALATLDYLAEKAVSERVRLEAAKAICDRAGLVAAKPQDPESEFEKPLNDLSLDELRARVDRYENELANRAINITPTPDSAIDLDQIEDHQDE